MAAGWRAGGGFEGDTEFLSRIAGKISRVETDLGSANPVLAAAVQRRMLGQRVSLDDELESAGPKPRLASDPAVREQVARLRAQLDATVADLQLTPDRVRRLVSTGLRLARQPPLQPALDPDPVWEVPPLTGTWVRAAERLPHPLRPEQNRPVTFDTEIARERREDVVYAHLNHPLVAMSTQLLTAAAASRQVELTRTTAVLGERRELAEPLAVAYARFLVVGGDAIRLHEEVLHAGGWVRPGGRFARLENLGLLAAIVEQSLAGGEPAGQAAQQRLAGAWPGTDAGLASALEWRVRSRRDQIRRALDTRRDADLDRNTANFDRFAATLTGALAEPEQHELPWQEAAERAQRDKDLADMRARLHALPAEREAESARIRRRFDQLSDHAFPLAVVYVVPRGWR